MKFLKLSYPFCDSDWDWFYIVFKQNYFYAGAKGFQTFLTKHTINKDNFYLPS